MFTHRMESQTRRIKQSTLSFLQLKILRHVVCMLLQAMRLNRVRLSLLFYVCAGIFMMGCLIHRYFVILGNRGTTDNRTLFRTFIHSQMISLAFYCLVIVLFDPLNGLGITGFRLDASLKPSSLRQNL